MGEVGTDKTPIGFKSYDGSTQIRGQIWYPSRRSNQMPTAIVQIVHGLSEHLGRYDEFAKYLVSQGFVVCAHDHIGHGKSVADPSMYGCIPSDGSANVMIEDINRLRKMVTSRYSRQAPYILFGHSFGSYLARAYLVQYSDAVSGVVLSGTWKKSFVSSKTGAAIARRISRSKGANYKSPFLAKRDETSFSVGKKNEAASYSWISSHADVIERYVSDPMCGMQISAGGYVACADILSVARSMSSAAQLPKKLPILFVSGEDDPIGDRRTGVQSAEDLYLKAGLGNISVKLYPGMRHEVLQDQGHEEVFADIVQWIRQSLSNEYTS